ncbi:GL21761 [Drosophila persimilis]|uniref:GL21761 n=1 Tax=Drosophila persimilis TaxID=7234 RepID=B4GEQ4_DROPE|nr:GL21761 [Drosophila persimilis]
MRPQQAGCRGMQHGARGMADVPQLHKIAYGKLNRHNFWANVDGGYDDDEDDEDDDDDVVAVAEWSRRAPEHQSSGASPGRETMQRKRRGCTRS